MSDVIIKTENLGKTYHDTGIPVAALKDINIEIKTGEFVVIAGPSGSGKTTLLNLIGALDRPTTGRIIFDGQLLNNKSNGELSELRLRKIGFIFQAYNLIPVLTALENIEFPMVLMGEKETERQSKAIKIMEELGIEELKDKRPQQMSGGEQQRIAVARAIVTEPSIVLADEPTANLDSGNGSSLMDLMKKLNIEKGITFVFASHDPLVISRAGRLLTVRDGQITKDELMEIR